MERQAKNGGPTAYEVYLIDQQLPAIFQRDDPDRQKYEALARQKFQLLHPYQKLMKIEATAGKDWDDPEHVRKFLNHVIQFKIT
jgi:hypothetical protein